MGEVASAYVSLIPSFKGGQQAISKELGGPAAKAGKSAGKDYGSGFGSALKGTLAGLGVFELGRRAFGFAQDAIGEAREAQKVGALTAQVIKSTGGAANVSAKQVGDLAGAISAKVGVDDEAIQSGANLLLTFKNVRNEAGKGNDIFNQATQAVVDMGAAMAAASGGQLDLRSSTTLIGKALNDPIKGLTALSRVGVTFSKGQTEQIKNMVEAGHTMKAQKAILKELRSEFGGAAEAQATAGDKAAVAWGNLKEQLGTELLPVVDDLADFTSQKLIPAVSDFFTEMKTGKGVGGDVADVLGDIRDIGEGVYKFFDSMPGPVKKVGVELGLAALATSALMSAMGSSKILGFITNLRSAETRASALRTGVRNLAGAGGMVLLAEGMQQSNDSATVLMDTLGGALTGAAFGGPVGAAVGGVAGAFLALKQNQDRAATAAEKNTPKYKGYIDTFKKVSGAATQATRDTIIFNLSQTQALEAGKLLGLSQRDIVDAVLGTEKGQRKLNAALRAGKVMLENGTIPQTKAGSDAYNALKQSLTGYANESGRKTKGIVGDFRDQRREFKENQKQLSAVNTILKKWPPKVRTTFEQNAPQTLREVARLSREYKLTPRQIKTLLTASGVDASVADVRRLGREADVATRPRVLRVTADLVNAAGIGLGAFGQNAGGTSYWRGGLTWVGERGAELIDLPRGSKVYTHQQSMDMTRPGVGGVGAPSTMVVRIGEHEFVGMVEGIADGVVAGHARLGNQYERSLG